jgi:Spy/CpxP family protein refolding chaperone
VSAWRIILATLVIFAAGLVTGSLVVHHSEAVQQHAQDQPHPGEGFRPWMAGTNHEPPHFAWPVGVPPRGSSREFLDRLDAELKLTPEQRDHIRKILDDGQECAKECWKKIEPDIHKAMDDTREKIRAELTPEQQVKYAELFKHRPRPKRGDDPDGPPWHSGGSTNTDVEAR